METKETRRKTAKKWLLVFLLNFAIAFVSFIYFIVQGNGLFTLVDDFNAQEISFNMLCNEAIKSGEIFWNWNIDIGSDFVTTFSFYTLGSPFFWLSLLFPAKLIPYVMPWMYMLKYAVAGLCSYLYVKRFVKEEKAAVCASVLYAFSGFQSCNLVFYHFHDVVAFFPLLLIGAEKLGEEKKKGFFAFAVALNALLNYFFFIGEVIFVVLYYMFRFFIPQLQQNLSFRKAGETLKLKEGRKQTVSQVLSYLFEGILGVMCSAVLFLPSILNILQNSRTSEHISASEALVYGTENFLSNLKALFFPADIMNAQSAIWNQNWYSVAAYLPLVGMLLVLVYCLNNKKSWLTKLLLTCLIFAFVPFLNNIFVVFTREPYRRWYYMPILLMALASAKVIENRREYHFKKGLMITLTIMLGYLAYMIFYPWQWNSESESGILRNLVFAVIAVIALAGVGITMLLIRSKEKGYYLRFTTFIALFAVLTTGLNLYLYKQSSNTDSQTVYENLVVTSENLDSDVLPYRYRFYDWYNNISMAGYLPSRNSFISTASSSITEFYAALGEERHVCGPDGPEGTNEVLASGYYVQDGPWDEEAYATFYNGNQQMYIYKVETTLPIGCTYETYMLRSDFDQIEPSLRAMAMLKTLVIQDEDESKVSGILRKYDPAVDGTYEVSDRSAICASHQEESSQNFWKDASNFGSTIETTGERYAFYSVPYDQYWSATVNGQETEILYINGLMAVRLEEGTNTIVFHYENKALRYGAYLSVLGILVFAGYMIAAKKSHGFHGFSLASHKHHES